jgi:A/G-specific adenine glycosylase
VWVSEIMLQQTQVATVERYYDRFVTAFPDPVALADAELDQVLHLWSGLGYYARARNLHRAAIAVRDRHGGELPADYDALLALPGIGRSTAGAILALALNRRFPILDGNAKRVLARVFGVEGWAGATSVASTLWAHAEACTPAAEPARYTQAIMDLGATVCTRRRPACDQCPLAQSCVARASGRVDRIPASRPKRDRPRRATTLLLVRCGESVLLEQRPAAGIWGGLWGFPEIGGVDAAEAWCRERLGQSPQSRAVGDVVAHGFTHFDLDMTPVVVRVTEAAAGVMDGAGWLWYNLRKPARIGLAAPVTRLLAALGDME